MKQVGRLHWSLRSSERSDTEQKESVAAAAAAGQSFDSHL